MTCPPQVWNSAVRRLADAMPEVAFETWIEPLAAEPAGEGLDLVCPSAFHRDRVRERYLAEIREHLRRERGDPVPVRLVVRAVAASGPESPEAVGAIQDRARVRPTLPPRASTTRRSAAPVVALHPEPRRDVTTPDASAPQQASLLYTFDNFAVGPANALAREACMALAEGRNLHLSPLYLVAEPGFGKTHLAGATLAASKQRGAQRAVYASAEHFTNDLLGSIRTRRTHDFKRRYRDCEMLVLEDVQFLQGKRATQLELFHTLEHLARTGARVLLTSERLPREIPDLDRRLVSRMSGGLCARIEPPDAALRREILRSKAAAGGVRLPEACADRILAATPGSVADLESVLIQVVASASLLKRPIDLALIEAALDKIAPRGGSPLGPERVAEVVASFFGTSVHSLASRSRRRDVLVPRQLAMYLCARYTDAAHQRIGRLFGRQHSSVANAVQGVERGILENARLRYKLEALVARLDALGSQQAR